MLEKIISHGTPSERFIAMLSNTLEHRAASAVSMNPYYVSGEMRRRLAVVKVVMLAIPKAART
jgi:hypothetical protein